MNLRVFVYEYLSGGGGGVGGDAGADPAAAEPFEAELLAAGRAMRDALVADLSALPGVSVTCAAGRDDDAPSPGAGGGAVSVLRPRPTDTAASFVARASAAHDFTWAVAPESDGVLGALSAAVEPARWIGCTSAALHLCSGKRATVASLAARGIATPLAFEAEATRWVVKPDDGAGCVRTRLHETRAAANADLRARGAAGEPATLEPWVEGEAMSLSLLCGGPDVPDGDAAVRVLGINRQRIELRRDGSLHDAGVQIGRADGPRAAALQATARAVVRAVPGLRGFVGIDCVWHAQRGLVVVEVNPRVTCAYVGMSALLARNLAADVLAAHGAAVGAAPWRGGPALQEPVGAAS